MCAHLLVDSFTAEWQRTAGDHVPLRSSFVALTLVSTKEIETLSKVYISLTTLSCKLASHFPFFFFTTKPSVKIWVS